MFWPSVNKFKVPSVVILFSLLFPLFFRWFYLENNKLCYSKRTGDDVTIMEDDLRICLVRPLTDIDRRFCFEIISPTNSHVLQVLILILSWVFFKLKKLSLVWFMICSILFDTKFWNLSLYLKIEVFFAFFSTSRS